jgi:hypothetical protein
MFFTLRPPGSGMSAGSFAYDQLAEQFGRGLDASVDGDVFSHEAFVLTLQLG